MNSFYATTSRGDAEDSGFDMTDYIVGLESTIGELDKEIKRLRADIKEVLNHKLTFDDVRVWSVVAVVNPDLITRLMIDEEE